MRCFYHPDQEVVATCTECGKGLCQHCASKWDPILCGDCAKTRLAQKRYALKRSITIGFVILAIGIIGSIITAIQEKDILVLLEYIPMVYLVAGLPNGWTALNKIQPNMFLFLPLIGWVVYFIIKFILAVIVGIGAFPINIYRYWKGNKEISIMEQSIGT